MKITSFQLTLRQAATKDGYGDNYYVNIDESGAASVSHPYKNIPYKEQASIFGIIQTAIAKYAEIVEICDRSNRALELEEYAPTMSTEEEKAIAAAKLSAAQELESAAPQSCALGDEEVSTGIKDAPFEKVETRNDKTVDSILSTKSSPEDGEAVAYFTEELSKIIDARKKKD